MPRRYSGQSTFSLSMISAGKKRNRNSAQCGAATACRLERRSRHGRLSWSFCLVRTDNDRHAGGQGLLRQSLGLGHSERLDAGSGLYFVYRWKWCRRIPADVCNGSKPEKLNESKCFPLFPHQRTSTGWIGMSEKCQQQTSSHRKCNFANKPVIAPVKANFPLLLDDHLFDDTATESLLRRFLRDWTTRLHPA